MALDVQPEPVHRRGPRIPAIVVLAIGIGIVVFAFGTSSHGQAPPSAPVARLVPSTGAVAPTAATAKVPRDPVPSTRGGRLPSLYACHHISDAICDAVATAGLSVLPPDAPLVTAVDAWGSILCGDTLDCPTQRLAASEPLGSAVISFGRGLPQAWVNVVVPSPDTVDDGSAGPRAWIVRWQP